MSSPRRRSCSPSCIIHKRHLLLPAARPAVGFLRSPGGPNSHVTFFGLITKSTTGEPAATRHAGRGAAASTGDLFMDKRVVIASALSAAVAVPSIVAAQAGPAPVPSWKSEKCYGLAKAGKNDCASTGNNSCAGTCKVTADPKAWIYVPEGYCERIVNGSTKPKA